MQVTHELGNDLGVEKSVAVYIVSVTRKVESHEEAVSGRSVFHCHLFVGVELAINDS